MTLKEQIDKYLFTNFQSIEKQRKNGALRWADIAANISQSAVTAQVENDYIRHRFAKLRKKLNKEPTAFCNSQEIPTATLKYHYSSGKEDKKAGTKEFTFTANDIPEESEIIGHFKIDTTKFRINQIYHKTSFGGKYAITVSLLANKGVDTIKLSEEFIEKVSQITPFSEIADSLIVDKTRPKACLFIPKQDAHWNKHDINGDNSIEDRFRVFTKTLLEQLEKVTKTNFLEEIVYVIGSDEFNSEWTSETTKGTPQQNILSYEEAFEKISEFNIETIKLLRFYAPKVEVVLLNGNHDHNVGWHLAHLLKQVFKKNEAVEVNDSTLNTKIFSYASSLILINHGDAIKPRDLAAKLPILAKETWSDHSNFYVLTGDKHHELAHDFNGTMFYQVPQLSNAKSKWDDKMGFNTSKAELLTFLFEEDGLSNILRKQIK